jgi:hypothetical protein
MIFNLCISATKYDPWSNRSVIAWKSVKKKVVSSLGLFNQDLLSNNNPTWFVWAVKVEKHHLSLYSVIFHMVQLRIIRRVINRAVGESIEIDSFIKKAKNSISLVSSSVHCIYLHYKYSVTSFLFVLRLYFISSFQHIWLFVLFSSYSGSFLLQVLSELRDGDSASVVAHKTIRPHFSCSVH